MGIGVGVGDPPPDGEPTRAGALGKTGSGAASGPRVRIPLSRARPGRPGRERAPAIRRAPPLALTRDQSQLPPQRGHFTRRRSAHQLPERFEPWPQRPTLDRPPMAQHHAGAHPSHDDHRSSPTPRAGRRGRPRATPDPRRAERQATLAFGDLGEKRDEASPPAAPELATSAPRRRSVRRSRRCS